jgi:hypothetical protein
VETYPSIDRWFSPETPASSTTKTGRHGIGEILLKVALSTINQSSHGGVRKIFEVMTSTQLRGTLFPIASLLAATIYQGNPDRTHKLSHKAYF